MAQSVNPTSALIHTSTSHQHRLLHGSSTVSLVSRRLDLSFAVIVLIASGPVMHSMPWLKAFCNMAVQYPTDSQHYLAETLKVAGQYPCGQATYAKLAFIVRHIPPLTHLLVVSLECYWIALIQLAHAVWLLHMVLLPKSYSHYCCCSWYKKALALTYPVSLCLTALIGRWSTTERAMAYWVLQGVFKIDGFLACWGVFGTLGYRLPIQDQLQVTCIQSIIILGTWVLIGQRPAGLPLKLENSLSSLPTSTTQLMLHLTAAAIASTAVCLVVAAVTECSQAPHKKHIAEKPCRRAHPKNGKTVGSRPLNGITSSTGTATAEPSSSTPGAQQPCQPPQEETDQEPTNHKTKWHLILKLLRRGGQLSAMTLGKHVPLPPEHIPQTTAQDAASSALVSAQGTAKPAGSGALQHALVSRGALYIPPGRPGADAGWRNVCITAKIEPIEGSTTIDEASTLTLEAVARQVLNEALADSGYTLHAPAVITSVSGCVQLMIQFQAPATMSGSQFDAFINTYTQSLTTALQKSPAAGRVIAAAEGMRGPNLPVCFALMDPPVATSPIPHAAARGDRILKGPVALAGAVDPSAGAAYHQGLTSEIQAEPVSTEIVPASIIALNRARQPGTPVFKVFLPDPSTPSHVRAVVKQDQRILHDAVLTGTANTNEPLQLSVTGLQEGPASLIVLPAVNESEEIRPASPPQDGETVAATDQGRSPGQINLTENLTPLLIAQFLVAPPAAANELGQLFNDMVQQAASVPEAVTYSNQHPDFMRAVVWTNSMSALCSDIADLADPNSKQAAMRSRTARATSQIQAKTVLDYLNINQMPATTAYILQALGTAAPTAQVQTQAVQSIIEAAATMRTQAASVSQSAVYALLVMTSMAVKMLVAGIRCAPTLISTCAVSIICIIAVIKAIIAIIYQSHHALQLTIARHVPAAYSSATSDAMTGYVDTQMEHDFMVFKALSLFPWLAMSQVILSAFMLLTLEPSANRNILNVMYIQYGMNMIPQLTGLWLGRQYQQSYHRVLNREMLQVLVVCIDSMAHILFSQGIIQIFAKWNLFTSSYADLAITGVMLPLSRQISLRGLRWPGVLYFISLYLLYQKMEPRAAGLGRPLLLMSLNLLVSWVSDAYWRVLFERSRVRQSPAGTAEHGPGPKEGTADADADKMSAARR